MIAERFYEKLGGAAFFIGSVQFLLAIAITELLNPGYSVLQMPVSDLGVGNFSGLFNLSIITYGIAGIIASYFIYKKMRSILFPLVLSIAGIGTCAIGIVTEYFGSLHVLFSGIALTFGAMAAIILSRNLGKPLAYYSIATGITSLTGLLFFITGTYLGIGNGGMERMAIYPLLLWAGVIGSAMLAKNGTIRKSR